VTDQRTLPDLGSYALTLVGMNSRTISLPPTVVTRGVDQEPKYFFSSPPVSALSQSTSPVFFVDAVHDLADAGAGVEEDHVAVEHRRAGPAPDVAEGAEVALPELLAVVVVAEETGGAVPGDDAGPCRPRETRRSRGWCRAWALWRKYLTVFSQSCLPSLRSKQIKVRSVPCAGSSAGGDVDVVAEDDGAGVALGEVDFPLDVLGGRPFQGCLFVGGGDAVAVGAAPHRPVGGGEEGGLMRRVGWTATKRGGRGGSWCLLCDCYWFGRRAVYLPEKREPQRHRERRGQLDSRRHSPYCEMQEHESRRIGRIFTNRLREDSFDSG